MTKKIISLILSLILAISCVPLSVFASENDEITATATTTAICVESTWCNAGKYAEVDINVLDNPGISGAKFSISYDENLSLISATEAGGVFESLDYTAPGVLTSPVIFNWDSLDAIANEDGTIVTLKFAVSNNVSAGDKLNISISCKNGDVYDFDLNSLAVTTVNGYLEVIDFIPGDVNGDSAVNGKDVTLIRRYNAGMDVDINLLAADVNNDGVINGKDVTLIRRVNAGWPDVELIPGTPRCNHTLTKVAAKESSCSDEGNIAYWSCSKCDKFFSDEDATVEISFAELVTAPTGHVHTIKTDAKEPTYTESGNITYWQCSECSKYFLDAACENEITYNDTIIAPKNSYQITYHLYDNKEYLEEVGVDNPNPAYYDPELGLTLQEPYKKGYIFEGWYDGAGSNANRLTNISVGTTGAVSLYAHWSTISYTITYKDEAENNNKKTYTIEDKFDLSDAQWSGLAFKNWTDENGNVITKIERGTTGNITLTANWLHQENLAVPSNDTSAKALFFDNETNRYYFVYDLGVIDNIVLKKVETRDKEVGSFITWETSETVTIGQEIADTIAKSTSTSISKTSEWSAIRGAVSSTTDTTGISAEFGKKDIFKIAASFEHTSYDEESTEFGTSGSTNEGSEHSSSISSAFVCSTGSSVTVTTTTGVTENMPKGAYHNVAVAKIRAYAVVTYDVDTNSYYLDTFSELIETRGKILYEAPSDCKANITYSEGLPFNVPLFEKDENGNLKKDENGNYIPGDIMNHLNNVYYVKYDANTGVGKIPYSVHKIDETTNLPDNLTDKKITKDGYTFIGWSLTPSGAVIYGNRAEILNIAESAEIVTLYAQWTPNEYKVTFDPNGGIISSTEKTVTYDSPYGALPVPTKTGYVFKGWELKENSVSENTIVKTNTDHTLVATWDAETYTIIYHSNGGTGDVFSNYATYNANYTLSTSPFTRNGYTFVGWSLNPSSIVADTIDGVVFKPGNTLSFVYDEEDGIFDLYAVWVKTEIVADYFSGRTIELGEGATHDDWINTGFSKEALLRNGYTSIEVVITFDTKREDLISLDKVQLAVVGNGHATGWDAALSLISQSWTTFREPFTIDIATHLNDDGSFTVHWEHLNGSGNGEHWFIGTTTVTATAK